VDVRQRDRVREHVHPEASEKDPGASLYIAELLKDAGLPDGVFNVVQGDKVVVDRLLAHPTSKP
jgi:malonate-semialdehyde dehydrogenase (acetylating)/methylmalonate-semialdehyde dehydrogenase